jgi:hypothetical protein
MNEFGEPNMGNLSVRFDEGRESDGHWPLAFQPILSRLLYNRVLLSKGLEINDLCSSFREIPAAPRSCCDRPEEIRAAQTEQALQRKYIRGERATSQEHRRIGQVVR